jgi:ribonucleoside-diphosphate reductase alpha chain
MDSFATAVSLALQHGVPLKVLCEKFAHTRFEPSGWTGNEQIGYAKSIMDYIFRWLMLRFLSGTQLDLFVGLQPPSLPASVPVVGQVTAPDNTVLEALPVAAASGVAFAQKGSIPDEAAAGVEAPAAGFSRSEYELRTAPPQEGIAPDLAARSGLEPAGPWSPSHDPFSSIEDRGLIHAADAMRSMYEMGDAPSCATCGAIMVRNGSCYRCMSCGSTSGCS